MFTSGVDPQFRRQRSSPAAVKRPARPLVASGTAAQLRMFAVLLSVNCPRPVTTPPASTPPDASKLLNKAARLAAEPEAPVNLSVRLLLVFQKASVKELLPSTILKTAFSRTPLPVIASTATILS